MSTVDAQVLQHLSDMMDRKLAAAQPQPAAMVAPQPAAGMVAAPAPMMMPAGQMPGQPQPIGVMLGIKIPNPNGGDVPAYVQFGPEYAQNPQSLMALVQQVTMMGWPITVYQPKGWGSGGGGGGYGRGGYNRGGYGRNGGGWS
jgi:hypothetical protein